MSHPLTKLLCRVDVLHFIAIDVDKDNLGGAVGQTGIQTCHCNQNNINKNNYITTALTQAPHHGSDV